MATETRQQAKDRDRLESYEALLRRGKEDTPEGATAKLAAKRYFEKHEDAIERARRKKAIDARDRAMPQPQPWQRVQPRAQHYPFPDRSTPPWRNSFEEFERRMRQAERELEREEALITYKLDLKILKKAAIWLELATTGTQIFAIAGSGLVALVLVHDDIFVGWLAFLLWALCVKLINGIASRVRVGIDEGIEATRKKAHERLREKLQA